MGEIKVTVFLQNAADQVLHENGALTGKKIRSAKVEALVDTGAVMMLLPQDLVEHLGIKITGKTIVVLADETKTELPVAGAVSITICERKWETDCLVGPPGCEPLIGHLVLDRLDLVPDTRKRKLNPNPESTFLPTLKLK